MTGVSLNENCPSDCPVYSLQGRLDHANSNDALVAYQNSPEIKNNAKNKDELTILDRRVQE
jgi:hypothetical protein